MTCIQQSQRVGMKQGCVCVVLESIWQCIKQHVKNSYKYIFIYLFTNDLFSEEKYIGIICTLNCT